MPKRSKKTTLIKKRGRKVGQPPGTLVHVGESHSENATLTLVRYNRDQYSEQTLSQVSGLDRNAHPDQILWCQINGVHDAAIVQGIGEQFQLHPLIMEDILNTDQRPKFEIHEHYLYIVLKTLEFDSETSTARTEQVSLVLGDGFVLTFQECPNELFQGVRNRLNSGRRLRALGADYLAYALIDTMVDNYFLLLEKFGDDVETLEEELLSKPSPTTLARIHHYKREMLLLRKVVWPLREVLVGLGRDESELITRDTQVYIRDVYDHTIHIMDSIDTIRDLLAGMLDLYISSVSNHMNEIMKMLTIFASIFMPLTFIAGIYGMNFQNMPELTMPWGYPIALGVMMTIGVSLAAFFRWKKWL